MIAFIIATIVSIIGYGIAIAIVICYPSENPKR